MASEDASAAERTLWVKREGAADFAEVVVGGNMSVGRAKKAFVKELRMEAPLDTVTVHEAQDREGKVLGAALDSTESVSEALPLKAGKTFRLVIKATAPALSGESCARVFVPGSRPRAARPLVARRCLHRATSVVLLDFSVAGAGGPAAAGAGASALLCPAVVLRACVATRRDAQVSCDVRGGTPCRRC